MMAAAAADHAELRFDPSRRSPGRSPRCPRRGRPRGGRGIARDPARQHRGGVRRALDPRGAGTLIAVAHQPPGGLDHGPARIRPARARRRRVPIGAGVIVAGEGLIDDLLAIAALERIAFVPPGCDVPVAAGPPLDLRRGRVRRSASRTGRRPRGSSSSSRPSRRCRSRPPPCGWWARPAPIAGTPRGRRRISALICRPRGRARLRAHRGGRPALPFRGRVRALLVRGRVRDRGPRRSRPVSRSSAGAPATSRASRTTVGRRSWPSRATSPAWHPRSERSRRIGTCATDSRPARADAPRPSDGRRRRTGSSPRSAGSFGPAPHDGRPARRALRLRRHALGLRDGGVRGLP